MAHAQKFPPICCTTQATSSTSTYVHSLGSQSRQASQQSVVPTTSSLSVGTDPATAYARACLPWQETTQKSTAEWCSCVQRQNAMKYVTWLQWVKQRTLSLLLSGIAGMTLSEQTNATILNTPHGVRHSPPPSPSSTFPGRTPRFTSFCVCRRFFAPLSVLLSGPPCSLSWALFAPVVTYQWLLHLVCPSLHLYLGRLDHWCICP